ncbi:MAG: hypothetical protein Q9187_008877, partial [Circinaria calcarea]
MALLSSLAESRIVDSRPTSVNHSLHDVLALKYLLEGPSMNLPVKVVEQILDYAEYWVYSIEDRQISHKVRVCGYAVQPDGVTYVQNWDLKEAVVMQTAPLGLEQKTNSGVQPNWWVQGLVQILPQWIRGAFTEGKSRKLTLNSSPKGKHPFRKIQFEFLSRDKKEVEYEIPHWFTYPSSWCDVLIQRGDEYHNRKRICNWQGKEKYQMHNVTWDGVPYNLYDTDYDTGLYFDPFRQAQQNQIAKFVRTLE